MKTYVATILISLASSLSAFAHGALEFGPKGGRLLEFSAKSGLHAEVVLKNDKFLITLFDEKTKATVPAGDKVLSVISGDRNKPVKYTVDKEGDGYAIAKPAGDDFWLILQLREGSGGKAQTARLHYEAKLCGECKKPEWLCACKE
jgi:hypothetical protein